MPTEKSRLTRGERNLLVAVAIFVTLVTAAAWWWTVINRMPVVNIPTPTLPSPNAYDYYMAVAKIPWKSALDPSIVKPKAVIAGPPSAWLWAPSPSTKPPVNPVYTTGDVEMVLKCCAPRLAKMREGFAYEYCDPSNTPYSPAICRELARELFLESYYRAGRGDYAGAMDSHLDTLRLGTDVPRGAAIIDGAFGTAIESIGRANIWPVIPHLNGAQARAATHRLELLTAHRFTLAESLQEEKWCDQVSLQEIFTKPRTEWVTDSSSMILEPQSKADTIRLFLTSKQAIMDSYSHYMDKLIANAKVPYAAKLPTPPSADSVNMELMFVKVRWKYLVNETQDTLLLTALALQAYRAEHGAYPASLAALTPAYLSKLPDDPFALKGPLRYHRTAASYLLYSIGPDGRDDSGKPSADGQPKPVDINYHYLTESSKGDIVAGVNVR